MPELPEVETIVKQLRRKIVGQVIINLRVFDRHKIALPKSTMAGATVRQVYRLGKQIIIKLTTKVDGNDSYLVIHLRMTGSLIWFDGRLSDTPKYCRACFQMQKGVLSFTDPRRFGIIEYTSDLGKYIPQGIEPLSKDFSVGVLKKLIGRTQQPLKHFLMRQDKIVGIGNIYAAEILYDARLSPKRKASSLNENQIKDLYRSIRKILNGAIRFNGTTISDFKDISGKTGGYATVLKVYDREQQCCKRCKTSTIRRILQQGRSTYYCRNCQK